jgi:hypothetical protein
MDANEIKYALAKQVPSLGMRVGISTPYGEFVLYNDAAGIVLDAIETALKAMLIEAEAPQ